MGVSIGGSLGPVRVSYSPGRGVGRAMRQASRGSSGGGDGEVLAIAGVLIIVALWLTAVALWSLVAAVLALSDLCFAFGRLLWWLGSEQHRGDQPVSSVLHWAAVRWFWRQGISRWMRNHAAAVREFFWWLPYPRQRLRVGAGWSWGIAVLGVLSFGVASLVTYVSGPPIEGHKGRHIWPGWEAMPEWGWWSVIAVVLGILIGSALWIRQGWVPDRLAEQAAGR